MWNKQKGMFFMLVEKGVTFNIKRLQRKLKREIEILIIVCWNVGKTWKDSIKKKNVLKQLKHINLNT